MMNIRSLLVSVAMLFSIIAVTACASSQILFPPPLEMRELRISEKIPGFEYQYWICVRSFLGICTKKEMKIELFDLTDLPTRAKLIDAGFTLTRRVNP